MSISMSISRNPPKDVFYVRNKWEISSYLNTDKHYVVMGGCTGSPDLPPASLIARTFPFDDLRTIERHERYVDYGAAVTLSEILGLDEGKRRLSPVFYEAVESIATPFVRNLATIGGNLCLPHNRGTLFPVLLGMRAKLRLQGENTDTLVDLEKFSSVPQGSYLAKIRVPVDDWNIQLFRHIGQRGIPDGSHGAFVFLGQVQHDTLADLRIAYSRQTPFCSRELENQLIGVKLPLSPGKRASVLASVPALTAPRPGAPLHGIIASPEAADQFMALLTLGLEQIS